jgi:hypothetical protein
MGALMHNLENPFRPGAGHKPPFLAGRTVEQDGFRQLLKQRTVLANLVLTGLRGVGKTVLLEALKPLAIANDWLWCGNDMSEEASFTENAMVTRILADIALVTSTMIVKETKQFQLGFARTERVIHEPLTYELLLEHFNRTPGLRSDKLKSTLELVWSVMPQAAVSGIVFAYDEAQTLADHDQDRELPLTLLLDVFQSIQRKDIPFMLVLSGLPTLPAKLVEARTYTERMFHTMFLNPLRSIDAREAIERPISDNHCPLHFSEDTIKIIIQESAGYPYFIQFFCKEVFDAWLVKIQAGEMASVPVRDIIRKLDNDFFHGRWMKTSNRQRELLQVVSLLPNADTEFSPQDVVKSSKDTLTNPFTQSQINQMLTTLALAGLVFKNRRGKYSLAVPLLAQFIQRQTAVALNLPAA